MMKKTIWVLMAALGLWSGANAQGKMSEQEFTRWVKDSMQVDFPQLEVTEVQPLELEVDLAKVVIKKYLENEYREYQESPSRLHEIYANYSETIQDLIAKYSDNKPELIRIDHIVPVIKHTSFLEGVREIEEEQNAEHVEWVYDEYGGDLIVIYAEDRENGISFLRKDQFDTLGIDRDTLRSFAMNNLMRILPKIERSSGKHVLSYTAGGNYESSLILNTSILNTTNFTVDGELVISVPTRDVVLIAGGNDKAALKEMAVLTEKLYSQGDHAISADYFRWNGEKFERIE